MNFREGGILPLLKIKTQPMLQLLDMKYLKTYLIARTLSISTFIFWAVNLE